MKAFSKILSLFALALLLTSCSGRQALDFFVPKTGYQFHEGVAYGTDPLQKMDIYVPDHVNPDCTLLFFYGGRWTTGSRDLYHFVGQAFASKGCVTAVADYRVYPQVKYPVFMEDSAKAFVWMHAHAKEYGGNPERLYVAGHSAGAYNAIMLAMDPEYLDKAGGKTAWIRGAIGISGPYDFLPFDSADVIDIFSTQKNQDLTQPIHYARAGLPPMLLVSGVNDTQVKVKNTRNLAAKLKSFNDPVETRIYPDAQHEAMIFLSCMDSGARSRFYTTSWPSSRSTNSMFVLKHNHSFAMFDEKGDIRGLNEKEHNTADGLISRDMRLISRAVLTVNGESPAAVTADVDDSNVVFTAALKAGDIGITRSFVLWNDNLYEKIEVKNNGAAAAAAKLDYSYDADFKDLFEVRGWERKKKGAAETPKPEKDGTAFVHNGADSVQRRAKVSFSGAFEADPGVARFELALKPGETKTIYARLGKDNGDAPVSEAAFGKAKAAAADFIEEQIARRPVITSSNPTFDNWLRQNAADIALLTTEFPSGPYPCAGIPWYSTPFGRDGIITAFQMLWQDPDLAKGVLTYLAGHQATEESKFHDSAPGKIMHEIRLGEMAGAKEVPHTPYYGTADATPLFISLAGAYFERTGDEAFIRKLWPNIERALEWIDKYGDRDGDGFVEYYRGEDSGLGNQGWKDSNDSISHADGKLAAGSIALCEVQGYVYDAKRTAAQIAAALGKADVSKRLATEAEELAERFDKAFWSESLGTYALALDGQKKPCLVNSSNPGHLLFSGIVPPARAAKVADKLMAPDMFTGWGIRTLSSKEKRYEPVKPPEGYHNGTVWVHDTALAAAGFARYGFEDKAAQLLTALFNAAAHFPRMRLPELFGGLQKEAGKPPAAYPVACNPQAWASASESLMMQAMLGIKIDGRTKTVTVDNPQLPDWLDALSISGLKIGDATVSLEFRRENGLTAVECIEKSPGVTFKSSSGQGHTPQIKRHI